ncbi:hypothetical protein WV31_05555 [Magnetospirillum sp. ME-1]|uniref:hypothetical protein n=1 Tax=Magnetospirillum sp. ME-1 TaxID=1639348 RepID=UPI000A17C334|nr:hypothetical protein [Magnetospirillum sp. ME-1]ARJ65162.1 hypothetical protein WV31_05555 [Magnetospirillum sp. ME-1]
MSGGDLYNELDNALVVAGTKQAAAWRNHVGWPLKAVTMGLGGGVSNVTVDSDGNYTPNDPNDPNGVKAIIAPVWAGPAPGKPEDIIDLAAWVPSTGKTFTRCGLADLLGEWAIWNCTCLPVTPNRLMVFRDPCQWAQAAVWIGPGERGGHGIVIIDWSRTYSRLSCLAGIVDFVITDIGIGQQLRSALEPPPRPIPRILFAVDYGRAA